jgi:hypothetical protein
MDRTELEAGGFDTVKRSCWSGRPRLERRHKPVRVGMEPIGHVHDAAPSPTTVPRGRRNRKRGRRPPDGRPRRPRPRRSVVPVSTCRCRCRGPTVSSSCRPVTIAARAPRGRASTVTGSGPGPPTGRVESQRPHGARRGLGLHHGDCVLATRGPSACVMRSRHWPSAADLYSPSDVDRQSSRIGRVDGVFSEHVAGRESRSGSWLSPPGSAPRWWWAGGTRSAAG